MDIFPYKVSANCFKCECGIEVFCSSNAGYAVVVVTELNSNQGMSICNAFEDLVPQVVKHYRLSIYCLIWIEHWIRSNGSYPKTHEYHLTFFTISGNRAINPRWIPIARPDLLIKSILPSCNTESLAL